MPSNGGGRSEGDDLSEPLRHRLADRQDELERSRRRPLVRMALAADRRVRRRPLRLTDDAPTRLRPASADVGSADRARWRRAVSLAQLQADLDREEAALGELDARKVVRLARCLDEHLAPWWGAVRSATLARWDRTVLISGAVRRRHAVRYWSGVSTSERSSDRDADGSLCLVVVDDVGGALPGWLLSSDRPLGEGPELVLVGSARGRPAPGADEVVARHADEPVARAVERVMRASNRPLVMLLPASCAPRGWEELRSFTCTMAARARETGATTVTGPVLVHPVRPLLRATPHDGRVRAAGVAAIASGDGAVRIGALDAGAAQVSRPSRSPTAVLAPGLTVGRAAVIAAGGLAPLDDLDAVAVDLCIRLTALGGGVRVESDVVLEDGRAIRARRVLDQPIDPSGSSWHTVVDRHGPALRRLAEGRANPLPTIAITTAAPRGRRAAEWGDWHLGAALSSALRGLGHQVRLQGIDDADDPASRCRDVHLVIRGLRRVRQTPGQRHVLWVISHPEVVTDQECHAADLVLVASQPFAEHLRSRTDTPVVVFHQATDVHRFRPRPPDPRYRHELLVVANARRVLRPAVAAAITAGLRPAIYGSGWRDLVDPALVISESIPNDDLPILYSSADLVLADHWDTMRAWGFPSNRLFDVLACGTPVVCDDLPEVGELLSGAVPTWHDAEELAQLVADRRSDPDAWRQRAEEGRLVVLDQHTMERRADELLTLLDRHLP